MASERSRSRQSPEIRLHPPQRRQSAAGIEEKVKDGHVILQRLQSNSRPTSSSLHSQERRKSCVPFGEKPHGEDVKTIRGKVRSTESLSGKGLIAADLLKNLKSQGSLMPRKLSSGLLTVGNEPQRCQTASDVRRSSSPINNARRAVSAGNRTVNSGPPIRPESNEGTRMLTVQRPQSELSPRLLRHRGNTQRRGSLPVANLKERRKEANSILQKYSSTNELDEDSPQNGYDNRVLLPSLPRAKSATTLMPIMHDSAEDDDNDSLNLTNVAKSPVPRPRSSSMNKRRFSEAKTIQQVTNLYSPRNDSSGDSDNEVRSLSSDNGSDSSDENDSESDNDNRKAERTNKTEDNPTDKNKRRCSRAAKEIKSKKKTDKTDLAKSKDSSDESNDSGSSSENESDTDNDENIDDNVNKQSKQEANNNESKTKTATIDTDSETDEDESDHDQHVSNDLVLINEELETLAKEMATPGMPAVDLLESHEKLINQVNHVKKKDSKKRMNHTNHKDDDEIVGDDIDDLIDTIDDLIDADDEDITYANKQELKKKSFKNKVGLVISTNKLAK